MPEGHATTIEVSNIMSFVLYTQILKQCVLKPASPGITLNTFWYKFYSVACPAILFYWSFLLVFHLKVRSSHILLVFGNHGCDGQNKHSYSRGQVYFLDSYDFCFDCLLLGWIWTIYYFLFKHIYSELKSMSYTMITINKHNKTAPHTTVYFVTQTRVQVPLPWGGEFVLRVRNAIPHIRRKFTFHISIVCVYVYL